MAKVSWKYEVISHEGLDGDYLMIHEAYQVEKGDSFPSITEDAICARGSSLKELEQDLERMLHAVQVAKQGNIRAYRDF